MSSLPSSGRTVWRSRLLTACVSCGWLILLVRVIQIQGAQHTRMNDRGAPQDTVSASIPDPPGETPGRNGHGRALQGTRARWCAPPTRPHQFADERPDPHSPLASFFWSHVGWILVHQPELSRLGIYERYAKDILRDPSYRRMEKEPSLLHTSQPHQPY
mgnify:CR=1 FL=1